VRLEGVQVTPALEAYLESLIPAREPVLARIEAEVENQPIPAIGPLVGQLVHMVLRMNGCGDVVELGTATGYSAIWLARGCRGRVVTVELDPERVERARANIAEAGLGGRVDVVNADAVSYLEGMDGLVDCVFNDLLNSFPDEATVARSLELSLAHLRAGGLLIADNALRRGEVVAPASQAARNVTRYNRLIAAEERLESLVVPLRDGVSIARLTAT
jgi:caffeoyl-CoA O-methyltransferase